MGKQEIKSSLLLFIAASIWGVAFVAQSLGMEYMGPFTFNGARFLLGGIVLLPFAYFRLKKKHVFQYSQGGDRQVQRSGSGLLIPGGFACGVAIFVASTFQQIGMQYTTVGKAGFITALYIVIVPVISIFLGKKYPLTVWFGVLLAAVGFYFLSISGNISISIGDILIGLCAISFSIHILIIDYLASKTDGVALSCIQFLFSGVVSTILAIILETPTVTALVKGGLPVLYAGILSCGVAYTLQILGQAGLAPAAATLILSLESVISVLAGWIILKEILTVRQIFGCILVFVAVVMVQLFMGGQSE